MRFLQIVAPLLVTLLTSGIALAQQPIARGKKYFVRVPPQALTLEGTSAWSGSSTYSGTVDTSPSGEVTVNGVSTWLGAGYPSEKQMVVKKTRTDRQTGQYEVELAGEFAGDPIIKLRCTSEATGATTVARVLVDPSNQTDVSAWKDAAYAALARDTFVGELAQLPAATQRSLLEALHSVGTGKPLIEKFKDKTYLSIQLGPGEYVYNTLQMTQTARVARRTADVVGSVKSLYKAIGSCPQAISGIKVSYAAMYKNFLREYESGVDMMQAYFPCDLVAKFQDADITSQGLVNGSIILLGDNRVDVSLTQ